MTPTVVRNLRVPVDLDEGIRRHTEMSGCTYTDVLLTGAELVLAKAVGPEALLEFRPVLERRRARLLEEIAAIEQRLRQ